MSWYRGECLPTAVSLLTISELNCSPLDSELICSLRVSSSDSSKALARETGDAGGGRDVFRLSLLKLISSEIVSHGWKEKKILFSKLDVYLPKAVGNLILITLFKKVNTLHEFKIKSIVQKKTNGERYRQLIKHHVGYANPYELTLYSK